MIGMYLRSWLLAALPGAMMGWGGGWGDERGSRMQGCCGRVKVIFPDRSASRLVVARI